jgi:Cysteine-rich CWC
MDSTVEKKCPRCGAVFTCRQEAGCWCGAVSLTPETLKSLRMRYADCLCEECLQTLAIRPDGLPLTTS